MKLTEAKLKEMILEAIKTKRFQDFDIPTPDEKLRADLGDEMFDKIQAADPEQSEIFKQSFDPNYPRNIEQESLDAILEPVGFKPYNPKYNRPVLHKKYNARTWFKGKPFALGSVEFGTQYNILSSSGVLRYKVFLKSKNKYSKQSETIAEGKIQIPKYFELSLETEQNLRDADSLVLSREKETIKKSLEKYR